MHYNWYLIQTVHAKGLIPIPSSQTNGVHLPTSHFTQGLILSPAICTQWSTAEHNRTDFTLTDEQDYYYFKSSHPASQPDEHKSASKGQAHRGWHGMGCDGM